MLNYHKLMQKLASMALEDAFKHDALYAQLISWWHKMTTDIVFMQLNCQWYDDLTRVYSCLSCNIDYVAVSIDGSQIYPNRHMGCDYCLINIGGIIINYTDAVFLEDRVDYIQDLYVFPLFIDGVCINQRWIDAKRYGYEIEHAILSSNNISTDLPKVVLLDGALIFWHLETKLERLAFAPHYINLLKKTEGIPFLWYISRPKNKDLIDLLRMFVLQQGDDTSMLLSVNDAHLMSLLLEPGQRTTFFHYTGELRSLYPNGLKPIYCYIHVGFEIARIECAEWMLDQPNVLELSLSMVWDQVIKGQGYPVVLSEAHHQAVIKEADRNFFFQAIASIEQKSINVSPKEWHKRTHLM